MVNPDDDYEEDDYEDSDPNKLETVGEGGETGLQVSSGIGTGIGLGELGGIRQQIDGTGKDDDDDDYEDIDDDYEEKDDADYEF